MCRLKLVTTARTTSKNDVGSRIQVVYNHVGEYPCLFVLDLRLVRHLGEQIMQYLLTLQRHLKPLSA